MPVLCWTSSSTTACRRFLSGLTRYTQTFLRQFNPNLTQFNLNLPSDLLFNFNLPLYWTFINPNMCTFGSQRTDQIGFALDRACMIASDDLCRQLAFHNSGDSQSFDVIVLTYSMLTYYETSGSMFLTALTRGVVRGREGLVTTTNMKLIKAALAVLFQSQAMDGTWRKGNEQHMKISPIQTTQNSKFHPIPVPI
jgi:hypothetical protein